MKLLTLIAIVLTVQCFGQTRDFYRLRDTMPLVDTCPEGTTWLNRIATSSCEVVAGCYTDEQKQEAYDFISECMEDEGGMSSFAGLKDIAQEKDSAIFEYKGKYYSYVFDAKGTTSDYVTTVQPETPITIEDIGRWIEHCYNDSTLLKHQHFEVEGEMCLIDWECIYETHYKDIWIHKDPNNIVELLEYLKQ